MNNSEDVQIYTTSTNATYHNLELVTDVIF
jgi:hypothetical protein